MQTNEQKSIPATLIPGDGIGPEISAAVVAILDALGAPLYGKPNKAASLRSRNPGTHCPTPCWRASAARGLR